MKDARGLPVTGSDPDALQAYERAVHASLTFRGDAVGLLDEALARAPGFAAAAVAKALVLMTFFERRFSRDALATLEASAAAIARATPRERAVAAAVRQLAEGAWVEGTQSLDRVLMEWPHDILALQVAHFVDFYRGDSLNLRNRVARVLPRWAEGMPGRSFVLGMHAFGLEECNQYPDAEAAGLAALSVAPEDAWAVHAVTHVYEMQGRIGEGADFLEARRGDWATPDNGFAFHNWWHLALFHMDRGDFGAALAIYDAVLASAHGVAVSRLDATSLLWRLRLEGVDVGDRFDAVASVWEAELEGEGGFYAFNDFHAALAFAATGRDGAIARLRERLADAAREARTNGEMTRAVGLDVAEAAIDFCDGHCARAAQRLAAVRDGASRFGGSHAQRDVLTLTLIEAARRAGDLALARHYLQERLTSRPAGEWGARIARRLQARAAQPSAMEVA